MKIVRPDIVVSHRASQEAIDTQLDLEKMLGAAVVEQAIYFRAMAEGFLSMARAAFDRRSNDVHPPYGEYVKVIAHIHRVAALLAATRILGRARILKEAGLAMTLERADFAEVLGRVGVDQAVEYIRNLPVATRDEWGQVIAASQQTAFTAAGVENKAALEALKQLVAKALAEGWNRPDFEKAAMDLLSQFQQQAGSLRTLWNTVTASAMARGRQEMLDDPDVRKIVSHRLYDAIIDFRTRPNHLVLDGGIAPWDWPGWAEYAPPNGFNCRCTIVGITAVRAQKLLAGGGSYFDLTEHVPANGGPDYGFEKAA